MKKIAWSLWMLACTSSVYAQWECPSRLGGALKQAGQSNWLWGAEATASAGWIKDNYAANAMLFLGLNYGTGRSNFYLEGGVKAWMRGSNREISYTDDVGSTVTRKPDRTSRVLPGMREAFYRYSGNNATFTLGLQSAHGDESYLLNERMEGVSLVAHTGKWKWNALAGSVIQALARNGRFCTLGYLYNDIVVGRPRSFVGHDFFDTNFGMLSLSFLPSSATDDFGESKSAVLSLDKMGGVVYSEFGRKTPHTVMMGGLYSELTLAGILLKPEVLYQASTANHAVIYDVTAEKMFLWGASQTTRLFARFTGYSAIDEGARPVNSFSNLFMGDVLRQDVLDAPMVMLGVKHSFTSIRTSVKVQGIMQTKASKLGGDNGFIKDDFDSPLTKMKELDFCLSKNFGKQLLLNATVGMLDYPNLTLTETTLHYNHVQTMFGRLELRCTF